MSTRRMVTVTIPENVWEVLAHYLNGDRDDMYDLLWDMTSELLDDNSSIDDDKEFRQRINMLQQLRNDLLILSTPVINDNEVSDDPEVADQSTGTESVNTSRPYISEATYRQHEAHWSAFIDLLKSENNHLTDRLRAADATIDSLLDTQESMVNRFTSIIESMNKAG